MLSAGSIAMRSFNNESPGTTSVCSSTAMECARSPLRRQGRVGGEFSIAAASPIWCSLLLKVAWRSQRRCAQLGGECFHCPATLLIGDEFADVDEADTWEAEGRVPLDVDDLSLAGNRVSNANKQPLDGRDIR